MTNQFTYNKRVCSRCRDKNVLIECACGCGGIRVMRGSDGRIRDRIWGHTTGEINTRWKGGRFIDSQGYLKIKISNAEYTHEHVAVYERHYQCRMLSWGIVHHINEDKLDNRIENLQGMTRAQHINVHRSR